MTIRRALLTLAICVTVLGIGEAIPRFGVHQSLSEFESSPPSHAVATAAVAQARATYGSPLWRLLYPGARVDVGVWPASCPLAPETAHIPNRVYFTSLHLYGLFGTRGPVLELRCGGTQARWVDAA